VKNIGSREVIAGQKVAGSTVWQAQLLPFSLVILLTALWEVIAISVPVWYHWPPHTIIINWLVAVAVPGPFSITKICVLESQGRGLSDGGTDETKVENFT